MARKPYENLTEGQRRLKAQILKEWMYIEDSFDLTHRLKELEDKDVLAVVGALSEHILDPAMDKPLVHFLSQTAEVYTGKIKRAAKAVLYKHYAHHVEKPSEAFPEPRFHSLAVSRTRFEGYNRFYFVWHTGSNRYTVHMLLILWAEGIADSSTFELSGLKLEEMYNRLPYDLAKDLTYEQGCTLVRCGQALGNRSDLTKNDTRLAEILSHGKKPVFSQLREVFLKIAEPMSEQNLPCNAFIFSSLRGDSEALQLLCPWLSEIKRRRWLMNAEVLTLRPLGSEELLMGEARRFAVTYKEGDALYAMQLTLTVSRANRIWAINNIQLDERLKGPAEQESLLRTQRFHAAVFAVHGRPELEAYCKRAWNMKRSSQITTWPCLFEFEQKKISAHTYSAAEHVRACVMMTDAELILMAEPLRFAELIARLVQDFPKDLEFKYEILLNNRLLLPVIHKSALHLKDMLNALNGSMPFQHTKIRALEEYQNQGLLSRMEQFFADPMFAAEKEKAKNSFVQTGEDSNNSTLQALFKAWFIFDHQNGKKMRMINEFILYDLEWVRRLNTALETQLKLVTFGVYRVEEFMDEKTIRFVEAAEGKSYSVVFPEGMNSLKNGDVVLQYLIKWGSTHYPGFFQAKLQKDAGENCFQSVQRLWKQQTQIIHAFYRKYSLTLIKDYCLNGLEEDGQEEAAAALEPIPADAAEPSRTILCEYMILDSQGFKAKLPSLNTWLEASGDGYVVRDSAGSNCGALRIQDKYLSVETHSGYRMVQIRRMLEQTFRKSVGYMYEMEDGG